MRSSNKAISIAITAAANSALGFQIPQTSAAAIRGTTTTGTELFSSQKPPFLKELVGQDSIPSIGHIQHDDHVYVTVYEIGGPVTKILSFTVNKKLALIPHVGVRVYGKEWFYSNRIEHEPNEVMDEMLKAMPRMTFDLGKATKSPHEVEEWIESVRENWQAEDYNVFDRNCNHFGVLMASTVAETGIPEPYQQATLDTTEKMLDNLPNWRKEMGLHFMTKITRLIVTAWARATRDEKKSIASTTKDDPAAVIQESKQSETRELVGKTASAQPRKRSSSTELSAVATESTDAPVVKPHQETSFNTTEAAITITTVFDLPSVPEEEEDDDHHPPPPPLEIVDELSSSESLSIRKLKEVEDVSKSPFSEALLVIDSSGTIRRRLWTKADFMHIHAVSGTYFLAVGMAWLVYSHANGFRHPDVLMETTGPFLTSLIVAGLANAFSAIPMSRFSSDKLLDLEDLKANGFTIGGTGLTCMSLWIAWWFSGSYPEVLRPFDGAFFLLWASLCIGSTANWEYMLQQNFENSTGRARRSKFGKESDMDQTKKLLYRIASWPNLTQLLFLSSIPLGGNDWFESVTSRWPLQAIPMYHYGLASAIGYTLSMFAETLRDRKLVDLKTDMLLLLTGFLLPMMSVVVDGLTYGDAVTINPIDYWAIFAGTTPGSTSLY